MVVDNMVAADKVAVQVDHMEPAEALALDLVVALGLEQVVALAQLDTLELALEQEPAVELVEVLEQEPAVELELALGPLLGLELVLELVLEQALELVQGLVQE